jgi:hypothetical protein
MPRGIVDSWTRIVWALLIVGTAVSVVGVAEDDDVALVAVLPWPS